jgi:hypothetical protein
MTEDDLYDAELDLMGELAGFSLESRHGDWRARNLPPNRGRTFPSIACDSFRWAGRTRKSRAGFHPRGFRCPAKTA